MSPCSWKYICIIFLINAKNAELLRISKERDTLVLFQSYPGNTTSLLQMKEKVMQNLTSGFIGIPWLRLPLHPLWGYLGAVLPCPQGWGCGHHPGCWPCAKAEPGGQRRVAVTLKRLMQLDRSHPSGSVRFPRWWLINVILFKHSI